MRNSLAAGQGSPGAFEESSHFRLERFVFLRDLAGLASAGIDYTFQQIDDEAKLFGGKLVDQLMSVLPLVR